MTILEPKFAKKAEIYAQMFKLKCIHDIYPGRIDMIIYQIYQLVGGFLAKFVSSHIGQNIFFRMIGNKAFISFLRWGGGAFSKLLNAAHWIL